ncbi:hypothetical protein VMCG_04914 [Cytospora schulzeri]|uniref:Rhodopsin domain-containing protein n=1 Tax=Cytospora schulzeri TaxID=448051 RepID=A0A423WMX3_9PEZI|nr:hypothetical protein VMCG_04914 [Valsa malicola]
MGSYKNSLIAAMSVFLILDTVAVAARVYVRTMLIRGFGYDDAFLCLSFTLADALRDEVLTISVGGQIGYIMACAMGFTSMHYGYAAEGDDAHRPYYDADKAESFYFANQLTVYISSGIVKIAVALVLYRLATNSRLQITLIVSMVIVTIWSIVTTLFSSWLCASSGASDYVGSHTCTVVGYFRMISNIFIDYFFALFPVFMLWNAKMSFRMKLSVCILLGLGMFASAATIAKLAILVQLEHATGLDADHLHYELLIWADVELGLAIFCASAAALRPLLKRFSNIWASANNHTPYGASNDASISCHPLSRNDQEHSSCHRSGSGGPEGLDEYELSKMPSNKSEENQDRHGCCSRQDKDSAV